MEELTAGLTEQGTVSLECKVVGIPSPALRWFKDGEEIRSGDVLALTPNVDKPVSVYRQESNNSHGQFQILHLIGVMLSTVWAPCPQHLSWMCPIHSTISKSSDRKLKSLPQFIPQEQDCPSADRVTYRQKSEDWRVG